MVLFSFVKLFSIEQSLTNYCPRLTKLVRGLKFINYANLFKINEKCYFSIS